MESVIFSNFIASSAATGAGAGGATFTGGNEDDISFTR
jgi:hypothetical protein